MSTSQYASGAGGRSGARSEAEFQKLSQTIATSIQKILQNGKKKPSTAFRFSEFFISFYRNYSIDNATYGWPNRHGTRFTWSQTTAVSDTEFDSSNVIQRLNSIPSDSVDTSCVRTRKKYSKTPKACWLIWCIRTTIATWKSKRIAYWMNSVRRWVHSRPSRRKPLTSKRHDTIRRVRTICQLRNLRALRPTATNRHFSWTHFHRKVNRCKRKCKRTLICRHWKNKNDRFANWRSVQCTFTISTAILILNSDFILSTPIFERTQKSIVDVNGIYKNLGALVFEQGHVIDSIEASVEHTSVFVQEGTEQLRKASHYKNQVRKKKLYIALILSAILLVIGFAIWIGH